MFAELLKADAQPKDAYGWLANQAAHMALVGIPASLLLLWWGWSVDVAPLIVVGVYLVGWEFLIQRGKDWRDSLMDSAMVFCGAVFVAAMTVGQGEALVTFGIYAALTMFGVRRRL